jgi:uncharacterized protein YqgC (DUF456 family)
LPTWIETIVFGLTVLTMLVGLFGLIVPIFPGNVIIWLAALIYGLVFGFGTLGGVIFGFMTGMMIAAVLVDNVLMGVKSRENGAAWTSIFLAIIAGVVGTVVFPPIGGFIASPLTLFLAEFGRHRDRDRAIQTTKGLLWGWGMSFLVRFGIGVVMVVLWGIWAFAR